MKPLEIASIDFSDFGDLRSAVKNEPMVYSASPLFAYQAGGSLTATVLEALRDHVHCPGENTVIDTRVHMLKPGWLPAIGGWHCDAIPRGPDKVPDIHHPQIDKIRHYLFVLDIDTGSTTQFVDHPMIEDEIPEGKNLWGHHSEIIQAKVDAGELTPFTVESGSIYEFSARDYHKAIPATGHGWRYFFRASVNTLTSGPHNEIRNQVQTYIPSEHHGW